MKMKISEDFSRMVADLASPQANMDFLHGAVGVATEAGELLDAAKKHVFYRLPVDVDNVKEELGDLLFYAELVRQAVGLEWDDIERANMDKLRKRYTSGSFSTAEAVERKDKDPGARRPLTSDGYARERERFEP